MDIIITLSSFWDVLNGSILKEIFSYFNLTIPKLVLFSSGYDSITDPNIPDVTVDAYNIVYDFLSVIPVGETTLADISLFGIMFGTGLLFIIIYSIVKWITSLVV